MITPNEIKEAVQQKLLESKQKELRNIKIKKVMYREVIETLEYEIKVETNTGLYTLTRISKRYLEERFLGNKAYLIGAIILSIQKAIEHEKQEAI